MNDINILKKKKKERKKKTLWGQICQVGRVRGAKRNSGIWEGKTAKLVK